MTKEQKNAARFKQISIMNADYEEYEAIRLAWAKAHGAEISMAKMIKVAMKAYTV